MRSTHRDWLLAALALGVLLCIPWFTTSRLVIDFVLQLAALGVFATSLNLLIGYGGMVAFGHALFFGAGAYTFSLLLQKTGSSIPLALVGAVGMCTLIALVVGAICVRLKEIYFSFLTLAFQMLFYNIILSWVSLTGGDQGLMGGIPRPVFLGINLARVEVLYTFACIVAVVCLLLMRLVLQSPFGYTLRMVRDNAQRAQFLGIAVWRVRLYAFMIAGAFAGVGGVLMALFVFGAFPEFAYWTMSGEAIFMIMMGGMNAFLGPVLGAGLFMALNDTLTRLTQYHGLALGVVVLIFALGFRRGISDLFLQLFHRKPVGVTKG